ncbi:4'-phosphopantetheinyl transferase [Agrocybe pediades]|nr:4'-phosphopantetheinyl transferase [Agrocybe pediades]
MPFLGIGVDLVHVPRIAALISRRPPQRFASRILSVKELAEWKSLPPSKSSVQFLAVRWCVKEAAYKAMYPVVKPTWKEITYRGLTSQGHKPSIEYTSSNDDGTKIGRMHVSVSHDGDYVYSTVLVEGMLHTLHISGRSYQRPRSSVKMTTLWLTSILPAKMSFPKYFLEK